MPLRHRSSSWHYSMSSFPWTTVKQQPPDFNDVGRLGTRKAPVGWVNPNQISMGVSENGAWPHFHAMLIGIMIRIILDLGIFGQTHLLKPY